MRPDEEKETGGREEQGRSGDGRHEEQETLARAPEGHSGQGGTDTVGGQGCIYFIETGDGAFVKIGYSKNVPRRLDGFDVLLPGLKPIGYMPGTMATERWLHQKFAEHRERGEWFSYVDKIRLFITALGLIPLPPPRPAQPFRRPVIWQDPPVLPPIIRYRNKKPRAVIFVDAPAEEPPVIKYRRGMVDVKEAGSKGGTARADAQTPDERSALASKAAKQRWALWRKQRAAEAKAAKKKGKKK